MSEYDEKKAKRQLHMLVEAVSFTCPHCLMALSYSDHGGVHPKAAGPGREQFQIVHDDCPKVDAMKNDGIWFTVDLRKLAEALS